MLSLVRLPLFKWVPFLWLLRINLLRTYQVRWIDHQHEQAALDKYAAIHHNKLVDSLISEATYELVNTAIKSSPEKVMAKGQNMTRQINFPYLSEICYRRIHSA